MTNCKTDGTRQDGGRVYGLSVVGGKTLAFGMNDRFRGDVRTFVYFLTVRKLEKKRNSVCIVSMLCFVI